MKLSTVVRRLYLQRYPLLFGLLLMGLGPLAHMPRVSRLLLNVLLVHDWEQVAFLTTMSLVAATVLAAQYWVIEQNGRHRFLDWGPEEPLRTKLFNLFGGVLVKPAGKWWVWTPLGTLVWLVVGLALPASAIQYSLATRLDVPGFWPNVDWRGAIVGVSVGIALFSLMLCLATILNAKFFHSESSAAGMLPTENLVREAARSALPAFGDWVARHLADGTEKPNNGYATVRKDGESRVGCLNPGHGQLAVLVGIAVGFYAILFWQTDGVKLDVSEHPLPTAFYLVFVLVVASNIMSALAFWVDRYRVPPLLFVSLGLFLLYIGKEHEFRVTPVPAAQKPAGTQQLPDNHYAERLLGGRELPRIPNKAAQAAPQRTLVIITAPGGGIHASVWTAQVLAGLHKLYGNEFASSIGLISAVSGGSVGSMYYLQAYPNLYELVERDVDSKIDSYVEEVVRVSAASSLESIGWGSTFPELSDLLTPGFANLEDRAGVLDRLWNARLIELTCAKRAPTLDDWRRSVADGKLPAVVFNATEVETGRRVLLSTVDPPLRRHLALEYGPKQLSNNRARFDMDVSTAARLSATFPYVTPAAMPEGWGTSTVSPTFRHVVDGGYVDNEGILTAVDWLSHLLAEESPPFDRVVLIRIRHHSPSSTPTANPVNRRFTRNGFWAAVAGPAFTVLNVRETSQVERGQVEADLIEQVTREANDRKQLEGAFSNVVQDLELGSAVTRTLGRIAEGRYTVAQATMATTEEELAGVLGNIADGGIDELSSRSDSRPIDVKTVFIDYTTSEEDATPPLNWKLTPRQFKTYKEAWRVAETEGDGIETLDDIFPRRTGKP